MLGNIPVQPGNWGGSIAHLTSVVIIDNMGPTVAEPRKTRPVSWIRAALKLRFGKADIANPLHGLGSGVFEIAGVSRRCLSCYLCCPACGRGLVIHAFRKKSKRGIETPERESLTGRVAQARTGFAAADFSRIRNADLARFTADRLMSMLNKLGSRIDVKIRVRSVPRKPAEVRA
jgi:hypothetical protein